MAPLAHAVRLVDDEEPDVAARQLLEHLVPHELLGCEEQDVDVTGRGGPQRLGLLRRRQRGAQRPGAETDGGQGLGLVLLERDER